MVSRHRLLRIRKVFYFYTNSQYGGLGRIRTDDRLLKRQVLYRLASGPRYAVVVRILRLGVWIVKVQLRNSRPTPIMAVVSAMRSMADFLTIFIVFTTITKRSPVAKTSFLLGSIDWEGRLYSCFGLGLLCF
jgi:hypothetical protein